MTVKEALIFTPYGMKEFGFEKEILVRVLIIYEEKRKRRVIFIIAS